VLARAKQQIFIHNISIGQHIKFHRDQGPTLPEELVVASMEQTPRPILQETLNLLIPLVINECCLSDQWEVDGEIRGLSLKWNTPTEYSIANISIALNRERRQSVIVSMPRISMDYISMDTEKIIDNVLKYAKDYLDGKYAQLELSLVRSIS